MENLFSDLAPKQDNLFSDLAPSTQEGQGNLFSDIASQKPQEQKPDWFWDMPKNAKTDLGKSLAPAFEKVRNYVETPNPESTSMVGNIPKSAARLVIGAVRTPGDLAYTAEEGIKKKGVLHGLDDAAQELIKGTINMTGAPLGFNVDTGWSWKNAKQNWHDSPVETVVGLLPFAHEYSRYKKGVKAASDAKAAKVVQDAMEGKNPEFVQWVDDKFKNNPPIQDQSVPNSRINDFVDQPAPEGAYAPAQNMYLKPGENPFQDFEGQRQVRLDEVNRELEQRRAEQAKKKPSPFMSVTAPEGQQIVQPSVNGPVLRIPDTANTIESVARLDRLDDIANELAARRQPNQPNTPFMQVQPGEPTTQPTTPAPALRIPQNPSLAGEIVRQDILDSQIAHQPPEMEPIGPRAMDPLRTNEVNTVSEPAQRIMDLAREANERRQASLTIKGPEGVSQLADVIADTISGKESGGKYDIQEHGGGPSYGKYQYLPETWDRTSKAFAKEKGLGDGPLEATPANQEAVTRWQIQKWLDEGYNPSEIASLWNSGRPDPTGLVGTNKYGKPYNAPAYVEDFNQKFQGYLDGMVSRTWKSPAGIEAAIDKLKEMGVPVPPARINPAGKGFKVEWMEGEPSTEIRGNVEVPTQPVLDLDGLNELNSAEPFKLKAQPFGPESGGIAPDLLTLGVTPERVSKFKQGWSEFWNPLSTITNSEGYLKTRNETLGFLNRVEDTAMKVWDQAKELSPEHDQMLFHYLDGRLTKEQLPTDMRQLAGNMRHLLDQVGKRLVDEKVMSQAAYDAHKGQYVRYMYLKNILGEEKLGQLERGTGKLDIDYIKSRQDLSPEQQKALGLIDRGSIAGTTSILREWGDLGKAKWLRQIADNPDWAWNPNIVDLGGTKTHIADLNKELDVYRRMNELQPNTPEIQGRLSELENAMNTAMEQSGKNPGDGWSKIPDSKQYGQLAGAYVRTPIARDIMPVIQGFTSDTGVMSMVSAISRNTIATFKVTKTALNPPTMFRNVISNVVQLNMSGIPLQDIFTKWVPEALDSFKNQDAMYTQAKRNGLFKTNWSVGEIGEVFDVVKQIQNEGSALTSIIGKAQKLTKFYGKIDDFFKLAKFIEQTKSGVDIATAAREAQKWGMDYSLADPSIKVARRHLLPFVTYQYKIAPLIAETLRNRPMVIAKYAALPYLVKEATKTITGDNSIDDQKNLPQYIKDDYWAIPLPMKSPEGHTQWTSLRYYLPWGNYTDLAQDIAGGHGIKALKDTGVGGPYVDALSVINGGGRTDQPPTEPYSGRPMYNTLDTPMEKVMGVGKWAAQEMMPSFLTEYGAAGYLKKLATGEKDKYGRTVDAPQAFGRLVGVNLVAPTPQQAAIEKQAQFKQLKADYYKAMTDPNITPEKRKSLNDNLNKEVKRILKGE